MQRKKTKTIMETPVNNLTKSEGAEEDTGKAGDKPAKEPEAWDNNSLLLVSDTCDIPVPGMDTVVRVRPLDIFEMRYPFVPTL